MNLPFLTIFHQSLETRSTYYVGARGYINVGVIKNIDGEFYTEQDNLKEILAKHIISPVRFDKAIQLMKTQGVIRFIEIGPGKTLTGFVKKDYPEAELHNVNNLETLEMLI